MIENLLQADNERIQRLQDEMINVQNRVYEIEQDFKEYKYLFKKSNQINPNEGQESKRKKSLKLQKLNLTYTQRKMLSMQNY